MAKSNAWTRDQLILALQLYIRTPFGKLHSNNPEIIELASKLGRTPGAVAMKACNFASLDPKLDRHGLSGTSRADREIWNEFTANPEAVAAEVEEVVERLLTKKGTAEADSFKLPIGDTDILKLIRARRVQSFFRDAVLVTYNSRCAITSLALPELLNASHIIPWSQSVERRADPRNGICLNVLFDRAFDRGLITIDEKHEVVVAKRVVKACTSLELQCSLIEAHGLAIELPKRFPPDPDALAHHREHIFIG
jgi:putative restriction endonuclease